MKIPAASVLAIAGATAFGTIAAFAAAAVVTQPPAAATELKDEFTYGPLRFRMEGLALDGSVSAKATISIENLSHSIARVVLAATSVEQNGVGLSMTSATGAKCTAQEKEISDVKIVQSEGETRVRLMTQIQALSKLTFKATFRCNSGSLSTADKIAIYGRVLTATEAGGFDIPLHFTGLKASAK